MKELKPEFASVTVKNFCKKLKVNLIAGCLFSVPAEGTFVTAPSLRKEIKIEDIALM